MTDSVFKVDCCSNRVALVTGGGSGIGFGIAKRLGEHGSSLVLMGRRQEFLEKAKETLKSQGIKNVEIFVGDVRSEESAKNAVQFTLDKFGKLDTLINCAAGNFLSLAEDLSLKAFKTVIDIDLIGTFNMCRQAFEALKASKNGSVGKLHRNLIFSKTNKKNSVNISATLHYTATWYQTQATAAKAGIDTLTKQLALEWGLFGIRVNGVAPGPIADTPGLTKLSGGKGSSDSFFMEKIPLGRAGKTSEIGDACVFLCSKGASYITGHTIVVDGASWLYSEPMVSREKVREISRRIEKPSREMGAKL